MGAYRKFHGISLAANSVIENLHIERLDGNPTELTYAGRVWYNLATKTYNFTVADETDTIVVRSVATAEALAAEITALDGALRSYVDTEVAAVQSQVDALGNAFNYVGTLPGQTGVTGTGTELDPYVLDAMEPGFTDPGDYYKIATAGFFKLGSNDAVQVDVNDGLVFNTAGGLDRINNQQSDVAGTADEVVVTGSVETGFTVALAQAIKDSIAANAQAVADEAQARTTAQGDLQTLTTDAKGNLVAAINEVDAAADANAQALTAEVQRAQLAEQANAQAVTDEAQARAAADGDLTALATTEKTNLVGAINEVAGLVGEGSDAIKAELDARTAIYISENLETTATFTHPFAGKEVSVEVWFAETIGGGMTYTDGGEIDLAGWEALYFANSLPVGTSYTITETTSLPYGPDLSLSVTAGDTVYIHEHLGSINYHVGLTPSIGGEPDVLWVNDSAPTHVNIPAGTVTVYCDTAETVKIIVHDLSAMAEPSGEGPFAPGTEPGGSGPT